MVTWLSSGGAIIIAGVMSASIVGWPPAKAPPPVAHAGERASLCQPDETVLANCAIGQRRVSICAKGKVAAYRYGRPGRIELDVPGVQWASTSYSGGGELQVTAQNGAHSYTLFDRIVRTGFGADGLNNPAEDSGLVVRRGDTILSARTCTPIEPIAAQVRELLPEGAFVEH